MPVIIVKARQGVIKGKAKKAQMIEEMAPKAKAVPAIHEIAGALTGRREQKVAKAGALDGILGKLRRKR